jgi:hypothetical protein
MSPDQRPANSIRKNSIGDFIGIEHLMLAMANGLAFYRDAFGGFECDEMSFCFH